MEIFTNTIARPSALPAACAPVSFARVILASGAPQLPRVHQVSVPVERTRNQVPAIGGYGINGSPALGTAMASKQALGVARGVPPRGRPV